MSDKNSEVSLRRNVQRASTATSRPGKPLDQSRQKFADTLRNLRRNMPAAPSRPDADHDDIEADGISALEPLRRDPDAPAAFDHEAPTPGQTDQQEILTVDQHLRNSWEHLQAKPARTATVEEKSAASNAVGYLVYKVSEFCNQSCVDDSSGWQVRLPLREDVLPKTTLHLSVSPDAIDVRFDALDADSRRLISSYGDVLEKALKGHLKRPRDISIRID